MIIEVKLPFEVESKELAVFFKYNAKNYIANSAMPNNFQAMENYIKNNFNITTSLRKNLIDIINTLKFSKGKDVYKVIIEQDKLDKIARLITFGNREIKGNPILLKAFEYAKAQL